MGQLKLDLESAELVLFQGVENALHNTRVFSCLDTLKQTVIHSTGSLLVGELHLTAVPRVVVSLWK